MVIALVLGGLLVVRQIFDKVARISESLEKAMSEEGPMTDVHHDIAELHSISSTFKNLVRKLDQTTDELRQKHSQLLTIQDILEITRAEKDFDRILGLLLDKSMFITGAQTGSVLRLEGASIPQRKLALLQSGRESQVYNEKLYKLRVVAEKGHKEPLEKDAVIDWEDYVAKDAVTEGKTLLVENIEQDERTRKANDPAYGTPSFLSLPIFVENRLVAVVNLSNKREGRIFDSGDQRMLSIMLGEVGFALENALTRANLDTQFQKIKKHNVELEKEIEARERVERALRESERKYRELLEFLPISVFEVDAKGMLNTINRTCFETFGFTQEDIEKGLNAEDLFAPDDGHKVENHLTGIQEGRKIENVEFTMIRKDGSPLPVLMSAAPVTRLNTVVGYRGALIDYTERRRAKQALEESEAKYRLLADKMTDIVWIMDLNLRTLYVSPSIEKLFGFTPEERMRQDASEHITPESLRTVSEKLAEEFRLEAQGGADLDRTVTLEVEHYHKDGSTRWVENIISGIRNDQGVLTGLHGVSRDITERKRAQRDFQESWDQLVRAEKLAAVGQLSAGVAHEILNPLNIIGMELQIMQSMENLSADAEEELNICVSQVKRIAATAESLKQVTRVSDKKISIEDINDVIAGVLHLYVTPFTIDMIDTEVSYRNDLPKIAMDRGKIEQVMMNLISNATLALEGKTDKRLKISTGLERTADGRDQLLIVVADNGRGIQGEDLNNIFDPFFTTRAQKKGPGLGLSISYGIVKDHGGVIRVENNDWGGATFYISLPLLTTLGGND
jgi:PAS domain S-box-containing protein